jgi:hypothetical protein
MIGRLLVKIRRGKKAPPPPVTTVVIPSHDPNVTFSFTFIH